MTIAVRAPVPVLRRGLAVGGGPALVVAPEDEAREAKGELAARGRAVAGVEGKVTAGTGGPEVRRDSVEVRGPGRQRNGDEAASSLSQGSRTREMLLGRLRAVEWRGAVADGGGHVAEGTAAVVEEVRGTYPTVRGPGRGTRAVGAEATVEVAETRVISVGKKVEEVKRAATAQRELRVREMDGVGETAGQRRVAQRRRRRAEVEAEEDLRLELVR